MTQTNDRIISLPMLAALVNSVLWGSALVAVKVALDAYDPIFVVFIRLLLAGVIMTPLVIRLDYLKLIKTIPKRDWLLLFICVMGDPCIYFLFEELALVYTSAAQAGVMWSIEPVMAAIVGWLILKEKVRNLGYLGFIVAMAGVVMLSLFSEATEHAPNPILGNILELVSLCGTIAFVIVLRYLGGRYPFIFVVWIQSLFAALFFAPGLALPMVSLPTEFPLLPTLAVLYLGLVISSCAQSLAAYAAGNLPVARYSLVTNLTPINAVIMGMVFLGESLTNMQFAAIAIVVAGVYLTHQGTKEIPLKEPLGEGI